MMQMKEHHARASLRRQCGQAKRVGHWFLAAMVMLLVSLTMACTQESTPSSGVQLTPTPSSGQTGFDENAASVGNGDPSGSSRLDDGVGGEMGEPGEGDSNPSAAHEVGKEIVLCLGAPPSSLFVYGDESPTAVSLRHALYESLYTSAGYEYQPHGLRKLPSLADGDATLEKVVVTGGERVSDVNGNVVTLREDVQVRGADGFAVAFDGTPLEMERMVVDFSLKPLYWSDGIPVTAQDSVYSFELASDPQTTISKANVAVTASYEALDDLTVRWTGIPGYRDQTYFLNIWEPVPRHALQELNFEALMAAEEVNKMPLSSGPFVVSAWNSDVELILTRNEHYYRLDEGLPRIERIVVRFGNGEDFLAGDPSLSCDVIGNDALSPAMLPLLEMAAAESEWEVLSSPGTVYEQIAFGIDAVEEYASRRPDWFEDPRVRQAITQCIDRQRMVDDLTGGRAELLHAYVSENHPLFPDDAPRWPYDPEEANALLDEAGYVDFAGDGRRQDVSSGIPMTITLGTNSESSLRQTITEIVRENLADCDIPVETYAFPAGTWYAEGPAGRLFGRRFDLAEFAWASRILPDCGLFLSDNITGPVEAGFAGWQNSNVTGWSSDEFDAACRGALLTMRGGDGYDEYQRSAIRIFAEELPAVPLFTNVKVAAARPWVTNLALDPTERSLLWNIVDWNIEQ